MSICHRCRAAGEKLYLKGEKCLSPKCPFNRRPYHPGQSGESRSRTARRPDRVSDYSRQLLAKQKLKSLYQLRERPLKRFYARAKQGSGQTEHSLLSLLERRLDSIVYRAGLAISRGAARQAIAHGRVRVNGSRVTTKSFILRPGDLVELNPLVPIDFPPKILPPYLEIVGDYRVRLHREPTREETPPELDESAVIEYLKR